MAAPARAAAGPVRQPIVGAAPVVSSDPKVTEKAQKNLWVPFDWADKTYKVDVWNNKFVQALDIKHTSHVLANVAWVIAKLVKLLLVAALYVTTSPATLGKATMNHFDIGTTVAQKPTTPVKV
jgi:hypothetical protein